MRLTNDSGAIILNRQRLAVALHQCTARETGEQEPSSVLRRSPKALDDGWDVMKKSLIGARDLFMLDPNADDAAFHFPREQFRFIQAAFTEWLDLDMKMNERECGEWEANRLLWASQETTDPAERTAYLDQYADVCRQHRIPMFT